MIFQLWGPIEFKQVLATKGLTFDDFENTQKAKEAADVSVNAFKEEYPSKLPLHPDQIFPDMPVLDSFWYAEYTGTHGCTSLLHM